MCMWFECKWVFNDRLMDYGKKITWIIASHTIRWRENSLHYLNRSSRSTQDNYSSRIMHDSQHIRRWGMKNIKIINKVMFHYRKLILREGERTTLTWNCYFTTSRVEVEIVTVAGQASMLTCAMVHSMINKIALEGHKPALDSSEEILKFLYCLMHKPAVWHSCLMELDTRPSHQRILYVLQIAVCLISKEI